MHSLKTELCRQKSTQAISEALDVSVATIERVRQQLVEEGFEAVLSYKQRKRNKPRSLDVNKEATFDCDRH
ncbi:MAG: helix-turn-helix domain-containing protein [Nostochopsis sp.]